MARSAPFLLTEPVIRRAEKSDAALLSQMLRQAFAFYGDTISLRDNELIDRMDRYLNAQPGYEAIIGEVESEPRGFAIFAPVFWTVDCEIALFLKEIYVLGHDRGQGLGRALMRELAALALDRGWTRVVWTVDNSNQRALKFYRSLPGARPLTKTLYMQSGDGLKRFAEGGN